MTYFTKLPAILLLADGTVFYGKAAGKMGTTTGEICFNTGMTGYQEIFTDPSYFGQIMVTTNAHIGNYGIAENEVESGHIQIAGLVCKNYNIYYTRKQANESIQDYFQEQNIVGISDIDTRQLVRHIRDKGAMNAIISSEILDIEELKKRLIEVPSMDGLELSSKVSTTETYTFGDENATYRVAVLDLGVKKKILRNFDDKGYLRQSFPGKNLVRRDGKRFCTNGLFYFQRPRRSGCYALCYRHCKGYFSIRKAHVWHLPGTPVAGVGQ